MNPQSRNIATAALAALAVGAAWWWLRDDSTGAQVVIDAPPLRLDAPPPPPPSAPAVSDDPLPPESSCEQLAAALAERALQIADECGADFARTGRCPEPLQFPTDTDVEDREASFRSDYADCPLTAAELLVDCSEYPCLGIVSRQVLATRADTCDTLSVLAEQAPSPEEHAAVGGLPWANWVPVMEEDRVLDARDASAIQARLPHRLGRLGSQLVGDADAVAERFTPAARCEQERADLRALQSEEPCAALRRLWGCPSNGPGAVSEERYQQYAAHADAIVDELVETCPEVTPDRVMVDCSSVPCLIVSDPPDPGVGNHSAFCKHPELFSFTSPGRLGPDLRIAVVWLEKRRDLEEDVRARFEAEKVDRMLRLMEEWER